MAPLVAPRFTKRFRRLCQVAAISGTGRSQQVVDGLLPVAMVYGDGPWREPEDWISAIESLFGLSLSEADVLAGRDRAVQAKTLSYNTFRGQYVLSSQAQSATMDQIQAGENLERRAQESWLAEVEHLVSDQSSDALWSCLLAYAGKAFLSHGMDAVKLLDPSAGEFTDLTGGDAPEALLKMALSESGLASSLLPEISQAIAVFFDGRNADRVDYVSELVNSTFNFLALGLDDETRGSLIENTPALTIFVDTNVIYSIIGAHANPHDAISAELFNLLQENQLPFKVFYHEKTLNELEKTMSAAGDRLRQLHYTPALSRARLSYPRAMSSIEMRYHQLNSEVATSVDIFLGRYSNLPLLLAQQGFTIFRESDTSQEESRKRAELVAEYKAYIADKYPSHREKQYATLDHDVAVWLATANRQKPKGKGPIFSGALLVSADNMFRRFDRDILSPVYGSGTWVVTRPDTLARALRLFLSSNRQSDAAFSQIFAMPEFRGIGQNRNEIVSRVAAYLATYADLPEETAIKLLANDLLMSRVKDADRRDGAFERLIQEEIVRENESLLEEREATLAQMRRLASNVKQEMASISGELSARGDPELVDRIEKLEQLISQGFPVNIGKVVMANEYSGGYFQNTQNQVGAQGPNAKAEGFTQQADQRQLAVDMPALALELERLKQELVVVASSSSDYQAVAEIQAAREAADEGDEGRVGRHLANAGRWALDVASQIGTAVAAAALSQALGM
ncbi:hypothetical protein HTV80_16385 [Streptomyces sp. Vc74B-19]|uniref:hypothetical protein n=1 Tax=Streptomyces sp. Vc74B-19 TaxID=2741324 RepID=UPI001BFC80DF|nr:hypothetical protein [Streptomyces sp. Vc74B-19]MBT3164675.1 hypothetical protein [Streptomyces sp. Vc74B-19]